MTDTNQMLVDVQVFFKISNTSYADQINCVISIVCLLYSCVYVCTMCTNKRVIIETAMACPQDTATNSTQSLYSLVLVRCLLHAADVSRCL